jgi:hypothetical protein
MLRPRRPPRVSLEAGSGAVAAGMVQKLLSIDQDTGNVTRLVRFPPGAETAEVVILPYTTSTGCLTFEIRYDQT